MRVRQRAGVVEIVLSRRNLLSGLHKLDMPGSARGLLSEDTDVGAVAILRFEDDHEHYSHPDRAAGAAGRMHPATEEYINAETPEEPR